MHWELSLCGNYPHKDLDHHKEMLQDLNIKELRELRAYILILSRL